MKKYKDSLKKSGTCNLCNKHFNDLEKHFSSKVYNKEYFVFVNKREKLLDNFIVTKLTTRKCVENKCKNLIKLTEPDWKIRCLSCYKNLKN